MSYCIMNCLYHITFYIYIGQIKLYCVNKTAVNKLIGEYILTLFQTSIIY